MERSGLVEVRNPSACCRKIPKHLRSDHEYGDDELDDELDSDSDDNDYMISNGECLERIDSPIMHIRHSLKFPRNYLPLAIALRTRYCSKAPSLRY